MTFLQFFIYYVSSKIIFEALVASLVFIRYKLAVNKLKKAINSGQIKVVDLDSFTNEDKKTWN